MDRGRCGKHTGYTRRLIRVLNSLIVCDPAKAAKIMSLKMAWLKVERCGVEVAIEFEMIRGLCRDQASRSAIFLDKRSTISYRIGHCHIQIARHFTNHTGLNGAE